MSWKNQSSRTNTGNNTFVNSNYSLSTNLISEESKILGKGLFYNDVDICGNLTVGGTLDVSNIDIELLTINNIEVSGNLLVNGTLGVSGDVDFSNNLFVAGDISCNGELHFADLTYDNLTVENKLDVSGLDISNNLSIKGTISGDYLFVDGDRIHIGKDAGQINQGAYSVAIGYAAGKDNQNVSIAIGNEAGQSQKMDCIAIGTFAGQELQKESSIAIGKSAGKKNQGNDCIAIGYEAGYEDQCANSIVLYAKGSGGQTFQVDTSGLFIKPIREVSTYDTSFVLCYNEPSGEVYYSTKTFVINHPIDENKYLVHACLEGPEAGVYYRGSAHIKDGETNAEIVLADYVKYIATDYTVNLTPIYNDKLEIPTLATSCVIDGSFKVYSNVSPCDFYYIVFGKRQDINVEPNKNDVNVKGNGPYTWI